MFSSNLHTAEKDNTEFNLIVAAQSFALAAWTIFTKWSQKNTHTLLKIVSKIRCILDLFIAYVALRNQ